MKYLHTMVRVKNIDNSLDFYCNKLGLNEVRRLDNEKGRYTLIFLAAENSDEKTGLLELTYNWDPEKYTGGRNFGHLAYSVENIYETCEKLMANDVVIAKHNIDEHPNQPSKYGVRGIPTMLLFKGGELKATKVGATTKSNIVSWIKENI